MIKPHGSETLNPLYVEDDAKRAELIKEAEGLPSITICSAAAGNAVMLGSGYFNPLTGYMNKADAMAVAKPELERILREKHGLDETAKDLRKRLPGWLSQAPDMPGLLHDYLKQATEGRLTRGIDPQDLALLRADSQKNNRRTLRAISGSALLVHMTTRKVTIPSSCACKGVKNKDAIRPAASAARSAVTIFFMIARLRWSWDCFFR